MRSRWTALLIPALVAPLAWVALYLPSLDHPFVWTDESALAAGSMLRPAGETLAAFAEPLHRIDRFGAAARQGYYRPVPVVVLSLVDQRLGREPRPFRIVALVVGAVCVAAFGLFAGWLFGRAGPALFAALFVTLHPVGIEATVWIVGFPATACALFTVAALAFGLASRDAAGAWRAAALGALSVLALALGLLSKERAVVEPALLVAALLSFGVRPRTRVAAGIVAAHAAVVAVYLFVLRPAVLGGVFLGLPPIGGSAATQVLTAIANWPSELAWLFLPLHSSTSDAVRVVESMADVRLWLGTALALGSAAAWWGLLRAGASISALGLAWIWIAFAPSSGLVPMLHASGERYLFLSAFGAALLLSDVGVRLLHREQPAWRQGVVAVAALLALLGLAERTRARIPDWTSTRTLFERDVVRDPAYREAYFVLGAMDFQAGRYEKAREWFDPLLSDDTRFEGTASYLNWLSLADVACNNTLALADYEGVLALEKKWRREFVALVRPPEMRICFGLARDGLGRTEAAIDVYLEVARQQGDAAPPRLYVMIARDLVLTGRYAEARPWLQRAKRLGSQDSALMGEVRLLSRHLQQVGRSPSVRTQPVEPGSP